MKKFWNYILSYFPTALPTGMTEFEEWQESILSMSKVPDNDSTRFATAVMVLHLDSTTDRKPKRYFVKALNKSAANELANAVAMGLKEKQKAAHEAKIAADVAAAREQQLTGAPNDGMVQNNEAPQAAS